MYHILYWSLLMTLTFMAGSAFQKWRLEKDATDALLFLTIYACIAALLYGLIASVVFIVSHLRWVG